MQYISSELYNITCKKILLLSSALICFEDLACKERLSSPSTNGACAHQNNNLALVSMAATAPALHPGTIPYSLPRLHTITGEKWVGERIASE